MAIGFPNHVGEAAYQATGFLYGQFERQLEDNRKEYRVFLITNRHVFDGARTAFLRFNPAAGGSAREFPIDLVDESGKPCWFSHDDADIDVAGIGINGPVLQEQGIHFSVFQSDEHTAPLVKAGELGISEGDGVFLLGFPMGLVGASRNVVIVRQGSIARIRDCFDSASKPFLIDCSVFPGNSGGPVVSRPEITAIQGTKSASAAFLIGVVSGYIPYEDVAVSVQTGSRRLVFQENSGLGIVFPVDYIQQVVTKAMGTTPITDLTAT